MNYPGISNHTAGLAGFPVIWGLHALLLGLAWWGWRQGQVRALVFWVWAYALVLLSDLGVKGYLLAHSSLGHLRGHSLTFWNPEPVYAANLLGAHWLVEGYWLGQILSDWLLATGLYFLLRHLAPPRATVPATHPARNLAATLAFLLFSIYPSLVYFGSPGFVAACLVPVVMLACLMAAIWRSHKLCLVPWALACGTSLATTLAIQLHRQQVEALWIYDQSVLVLTVRGGLLSAAFWAAGLGLAWRHIIPPKSREIGGMKLRDRVRQWLRQPASLTPRPIRQRRPESRVARVGLRLVNIYLAVAFVIWKWASYYVDGDRGLAFNFSAGPGSEAVGAGYLLGVVILLGAALRQYQDQKDQRLTTTLIFAGIGLFYGVMGTGYFELTAGFIEAPARWGMSALMVYFSFKCLRTSKNRGFNYWVWGYAINLVREIGFKVYVAAITPVYPGRNGSAWFWLPEPHYGGGNPLAGWLLEVYWLGNIVASALIAAGLVLLTRQWGPEISRPPPPRTAQWVAIGILFLMLTLYPSMMVFGSPDVLATLVVNVVMLGYALYGCRRPQGRCFICWAVACTLTLLVPLAGWLHHAPAAAPNYIDQYVSQTLQELLVLAELAASGLWVAGLWLGWRQLVPAAPPGEDKSETPATARKLPFIPRGRQHRLAGLAAAGMLVVGLVWLWVGEPAQIFTLQPKYEGYKLSYWLDNWYVNSGSGQVNHVAEDAVRAMGAKAVPYLLDWIDRPYTANPGGDYPERAVQGFAVLGPVAKPAVPKLIAMLGRRPENAQRALLGIGPVAVPALADKLLETLADPNPPVFIAWFRPSPAQVQLLVLGTLCRMGTNAGAALPALIQAARSNNARTQIAAATALAWVGANQPDTVLPVLLNCYTNTANAPATGFTGQAAMASALAVAGQSQPERVVPILISLFDNIHTNLVTPGEAFPGFIYFQYFQPEAPFPDWGSSPTTARAWVAGALAAFGPAASAALPALRRASQDAEPEVRAQAAVAIQKIVPESPDALGPLIANLTDPAKSVREEALKTLTTLGLPAKAALPVIVRQSLHDPEAEVRQAAIDCVTSLGPLNDEAITALGDNAMDANESVAQSAVNALVNLAGHSQAAFLELARVSFAGSVYSIRLAARNSLQYQIENNTTLLSTCLADTNPAIRYQALRLVDKFGVDLPQTRPALQQALHDENPDARSLATNMLMQLETRH